MKSMKKLLAGVLALTMLVGTAAFAADSPATVPEKVEKKTNGVTVTVKPDANGGAALTAVAKTSKTTVKITKVGGYNVTTINGNAFKNCTKAKTIELPATVTTIKANAFKGCKQLKTIKIGIKNAKKLTVKSGAFKGLKTNKMVIKVSKSTKSADLKKIQAAFKKAGFKGTVKKG